MQVNSAIAKDPLGAFSDPLSVPSSTTSNQSTIKPISSPLTPNLEKKSSTQSKEPESPSLNKKESNATSSSTSQKSTQQGGVVIDESFIPWKAKKAGILSEFTTDETIGVTVSFVEGADSSGKGFFL
jgi:hypothetical protein